MSQRVGIVVSRCISPPLIDLNSSHMCAEQPVRDSMVTVVCWLELFFPHCCDIRLLLTVFITFCSYSRFHRTLARFVLFLAFWHFDFDKRSCSAQNFRLIAATPLRALDVTGRTSSSSSYRFDRDVQSSPSPSPSFYLPSNETMNTHPTPPPAPPATTHAVPCLAICIRSSAR
jgi:hypothetical protein